MSESPQAEHQDGLPETVETRVIAQIAVYSASKGTKGKVKESKAQKTKELVFVFSPNNYVEFLQAVLAKHAQEKYKVTERRPYPFKYLHPPSKAYVRLFFAWLLLTVCSASNAVDVDSAKDWLDMYRDIAVVLPKKIKILVDLKTVKQLCCLNVSILFYEFGKHAQIREAA